jgi:hypothetical protein
MCLIPEKVIQVDLNSLLSLSYPRLQFLGSSSGCLGELWYIQVVYGIFQRTPAFSSPVFLYFPRFVRIC